MPDIKFECILRNFHLCDNKHRHKVEKLSKLCPVISELNEMSLKFYFQRDNKSVNQ